MVDKNNPLWKLVRPSTLIEQRLDFFMKLSQEWKSKYKKQRHNNILLSGKLRRIEERLRLVDMAFAYQEKRKIEGLFVLRTTYGIKVSKKFKTYEEAERFAKYNVSNHPEIEWKNVYNIILV